MNIKNIKFLEITVIREIYRNSGSSAEVKNKIKYRVQTQYRHTTDNERVKKKNDCRSRYSPRPQNTGPRLRTSICFNSCERSQRIRQTERYEVFR